MHARVLCGAAVAMADSAEVSALVAMTRAGKTARLLAAMRPNAPIFAITPNRQTGAALALVWGVTPVLTDLYLYLLDRFFDFVRTGRESVPIEEEVEVIAVLEAGKRSLAEKREVSLAEVLG